MTNVFETMNTEATTSTTTEVTTKAKRTRRPDKTKAEKLALIDSKIAHFEGRYKALEAKRPFIDEVELNKKIADILNALDKLKDDRKRVEAEEELTKSERVARGMAKRKAMLDALRAKKASGEELTPEEQETLDKATSAAQKRAEGVARAREERKAKLEAIKAKRANGETLTDEEIDWMLSQIS